MSRVKKAKFNLLSSSTLSYDFRTFLRNSKLESDYIRISQLDIILGRFVNFSYFVEYDITSYLLHTSLYELFFIEFT